MSEPVDECEFCGVALVPQTEPIFIVFEGVPDAEPAFVAWPEGWQTIGSTVES